MVEFEMLLKRYSRTDELILLLFKYSIYFNEFQLIHNLRALSKSFNIKPFLKKHFDSKLFNIQNNSIPVLFRAHFVNKAHQLKLHSLFKYTQIKCVSFTTNNTGWTVLDQLRFCFVHICRISKPLLTNKEITNKGGIKHFLQFPPKLSSNKKNAI